ncbi:Calcium-binding EF hand family protein [Perilla frutescens var. hirtella]|uniref:Calcium-binding EF hand family protein n=1 Tax=Perilla frutescens var. hirtella TaxID=608512 RepID=A0AAD4JDG3_PERFH|nr:Calcium-binding EF hand family protein [Perilla frutescens var. hirtella]
MGKLSLIVYISVAIVVLILISRTTTNKSHRGRHRRLKVRSNFTFTAPGDNHHLHDRVTVAAFDPLVAEIERKREDKQWEHHYLQVHHPESIHSTSSESPEPEWEDFMNAEDYLNDEEKFNVTNRLVLLFPNVDVEPADGYVTERELTLWNLKQSQKEVLHRTEREMEVHDKNKDGFVSLAEYEPPSWVVDSDNYSFGYEMGWWKQDHFNASDIDGDGRLNITEFNDFLHPSDTKNPKLLLWLCKEEIRERDSDKDGKVNFKEFYHGIFDLVRAYNQGGHHDYSHESADEAPAKTLFDELDKDGDGYLSDSELLPIIGKLHPSERYYAKQQSEYIMLQADTDQDGRLTLTEMIENPYVFYSAVFDDEEDEDYDYHDEFR